MNAKQLIEVLSALPPHTEIRVPYGDDPGEQDYVTGVIQIEGQDSVLLTATREHHEMNQGPTLWER